MIAVVLFLTAYSLFVAVGGQGKECQQELMTRSNMLRLKKDLLCGYDRALRPVMHHANKTTVYVELSPINFYMDERYHSLGVSCLLTMHWIDEFLQWNPSSYDGLEDFYFDSNTVWVPDIAPSTSLYRRTGGGISQVGVRSTGEAYMAQTQYFTTYCVLDYTMWPYDFQKCSLELRTSSYYWPYFDLKIVETNKDELQKFYNKPGPWVLIDMNSSRLAYQSFPRQDLYIITINYEFLIQRHASLYNSALVTAAVVLPLLVLSAFWLSPHSGSRLNLCALVLVSHAFHLEQLTFGITNSGDLKPTIVTYCQGCVILAALCLIFTIVSRVVSELSTGPYILHRLSSWICSSHYAQSLLLIEINYKNDMTDESEDESSLVIRNGRFLQQWKVLATFIDRVLFILYFICYIFLYIRYFPS